MSARLQVLLPAQEMEDIRQASTSENLSVGEWVRHCLRAARQSKPNGSTATKLAIIRHAARLSDPTADIKRMLSESDQGKQ